VSDNLSDLPIHYRWSKDKGRQASERGLRFGIEVNVCVFIAGSRSGVGGWEGLLGWDWGGVAGFDVDLRGSAVSPYMF